MAGGGRTRTGRRGVERFALRRVQMTLRPIWSGQILVLLYSLNVANPWPPLRGQDPDRSVSVGAYQAAIGSAIPAGVRFGNDPNLIKL